MSWQWDRRTPGSPIVAVVGKGRDCPASVVELATDLGVALGVSDLDIVLLTGGMGGTMLAASDGFTRYKDRLAIALRPGSADSHGWVEGAPNDGTRYPAFVLYTGLPESVRNVVTASMADVMLVLPGSHGTVTEAVIALDRGIPVLKIGDHGAHTGYLTASLPCVALPVHSVVAALLATLNGTSASTSPASNRPFGNARASLITEGPKS